MLYCHLAVGHPYLKIIGSAALLCLTNVFVLAIFAVLEKLSTTDDVTK